MFSNIIYYLKNFLKDLILILIGLFRPINKDKGAVFMYHSVSNISAFFNVSPENFLKQIKFLKNKNYKFVKLSDLLNLLKNKKSVSNTVSLTFDDGYMDIYQNVFTILKQYNLPGTVFMATDFIGKKMTTSDGVTIDTLSGEQIKIMEDSGLVEFLPHSMSHRNMDLLSSEDVAKEIEDSFDKLSKIARSTKKIFSYPRGRFNDDMVEYLKDHDWYGAVTVKEGMVGWGDDLFKLKRLAVVSSTSFVQFKAKVYGYTEVYESMKSFFFKKNKLWNKEKK